jgi:hypothetical protein
MTGDSGVRGVREALAAAGRAGGSAAAAARRSVRRHLLAVGIASALAILGSGLLARWGGDGIAWPRAVAIGVLWAAVFGGAFALLSLQAVRAAPMRGRAVAVAVAGAAVTGAAMAIGPEFPAAYPLGAAAAMGVWALGAAWVGASPR